jgi:hypothetical protein
VGINLVGRNYGISAARSGPEISSCGKEIFGVDADVISRDSSLMDSNEHFRIYHYHIRNGGRNPNRPVVIDFLPYSGQAGIMQELEDMGLASFTWGPAFDRARELMPDCASLRQEEIDSLPALVRNYKCGNEFEHGDPYCSEEKFNLTLCGDRRYTVSWHPGKYVRERIVCGGGCLDLILILVSMAPFYFSIRLGNTMH